MISYLLNWLNVGTKDGVYSEHYIDKVNALMFKYDVQQHSSFNATIAEIPELAQLVEGMKKTGANNDI